MSGVTAPRTRRLLRCLVGVLGLLLVATACWPAPTASAAEPARLVMVLDSSGSMEEKVGGSTKIAIAKDSLRAVVRKLPADAPVGLRVYGATVFDRDDEGACTDSQLVVPIGTGNRAALTDEIAQYEPYGETPISYSLQQAADDLGAEGKRTILLVSDGEETCDADPCATAAKIADAGVDVKIDVVGLAVSGATRSQLQCVARRGNGTYYDADSRDDLENSLDKLATRAFRPFRLTGTPVEGSTKRSSAPVVVPGQYVDALPGRKKPVYYELPRTTPGSTLHLGFTARPVGTVPAASLRLYQPDGTECDSTVALAIAGGGSSPVVTGEVSSWKSDEDSPCNTAGSLLASVEAANDELIGAPFELLVGEEPPLGDDRSLPPADDEVRWRPMKPAKAALEPPVPGTSISDAPVLAPGTYRTTILSGETQVFAVAADWGQRVQVDVVIPPRRGALARALSVQDSLDLQLLGAGRGQYLNLQTKGLPPRSFTLVDDTQRYEVAGSTPTITYLNRSQFGAEQYAAVPGPQYAVLNMRGRQDKPFLVPYTLVVSVIGTAGEGRPEYVAASPSPTPEPASPTPVPPVSTPPVTSSGSGVPLPVVVGVAAGTLVLGAAGAGLALWLRRRRRPAR